MRLFVCVFIEKLPWRQRNRAQQKSVAQPSPAQDWSSSNTDKETSVSTVANTHHAAASFKNTLLFNNLLQMFSSQTFSNTVYNRAIYNSTKTSPNATAEDTPSGAPTAGKKI